MIFWSYFKHPYFSKITHIFEDKYGSQNKLKESRITSIILNWKKAAVILIKTFWPVKLLYSYMRQLYQMIDYINWLTATYTNKLLFLNLLQYYNSICPNLSCLDIFVFMIIWWWTDSHWCNLTLAWRFWATKMCLRESKICKNMSVLLPNWASNFLKSKFWKLF